MILHSLCSIPLYLATVTLRPVPAPTWISEMQGHSLYLQRNSGVVRDLIVFCEGELCHPPVFGVHGSAGVSYLVQGGGSGFEGFHGHELE